MRHPTQLHSGGFDWTKIRVLVFSQDDGFRFLVRQTFRKLNVREVLSSSVAADATGFMGQGPNIGLIDLDGDPTSALAFLERVRAADAAMPVLMVARTDNKPQVANAVPLGIEGFLPKPLSGHELSHRVAESIQAPRRVPIPAAPPPVPAFQPRPPDPAAAAPSPLPPSAGTPAPLDKAALAEAQKAELAALTARLGRVASGGTAGSGAGRLSGGTVGGDMAAPPKKPAGGKLDMDDMRPPAKAGGGTLGDDDFPPAGAGKKKKTKLDILAEALPETLRPKHRDDDEEAARQRARWLEELAATGHEERQGEDVAGLNVEAIVAAHVQWLTTQGAQGKRAEFKGMDLAGGDLAGTVLANAGFRDADLSDANLAEARLDGADFRHASLSAADLSGANMGVAQLRHSDLQLANLQGASLRGADLSGAKLRGAKLAGADFKGATLVGTSLREADLSQVNNLIQSQVDKAECDMKTKLPPGVRRPRPDEE